MQPYDVLQKLSKKEIFGHVLTNQLDAQYLYSLLVRALKKQYEWKSLKM